MRFIGERRALAASVFAFFFVYLTLILLSPDVPGQMKPMFWGRAGVSLPFVLLYALQPKTGAVSFIASLAALALTGLGMRGIIKLRAWGVMAIGAAGVILLALAGNDALTGNAMLVLKPALAGGL